MSTIRTITLSDRPPVRIDEDTWPVVGKADDKEWDNTYECQANQIWKWFLRVRQHDDGRAVVYAGYDHSSNWQGSRDTHCRHGQLLPAGSDMDAICRAIKAVAARMDGEHWDRIAEECIADLPAEELA
jgi:hypothetical protein